MNSSTSSGSGAAERSKTPAAAGSFFATRPAALARVFVAPVPIETGIPVHCRTVAQIARARSAGGGPARRERSRKASSIE